MMMNFNLGGNYFWGILLKKIKCTKIIFGKMSSIYNIFFNPIYIHETISLFIDFNYIL